MAVSRPAGPGRSRSVRAGVGVALLAVATLGVLASLPTRSPLWTGLAAVTALVLSSAALRVMWTEVLRARRDRAGDRAAAASAYREMATVRESEHAARAAALTERLAEAHLCNRELEGRLAQAQARVSDAESHLAESRARCRTLEQDRALDPERSSGVPAGWPAVS